MQYGCKCRENAIYFNSSTIFFTIFLPVPEFSFRSFFEIGFSTLLKYILCLMSCIYIEWRGWGWGWEEENELVDSLPARIPCRFKSFEYPFGWHYVHSISLLSSFIPLNPPSWSERKQFNNATRCKINLSPQEINWKFIICHFGITK